MINVKANGASIPALGMGTWELRGEECARLVSHALNNGYSHVDTAAKYENEEAVGEGLRASGIARDDIFVTTKVWSTECFEGELQRSAEASLKRLGLDQVDLLLIHWPNADATVEEQVGALCAAKKAGLTRHIGVSNFPSKMLKEAIAATTEPLVTNQVEYHPLLAQEKLLEVCRENDMSLTSYCPIARAEIFSEPVLVKIAEAVGKTVPQVILRWHVQQKGVIAVPRSSKPERLDQNVDIFDFELSDEQMAAIHGLARPDGRLVNMPWAPDWD